MIICNLQDDKLPENLSKSNKIFARFIAIIIFFSVRKIKAFRRISNCLDRLFKKKAFAHNNLFPSEEN